MESILGDRAIGIHPAEQAFVRAGGDLQGRLLRSSEIRDGIKAFSEWPTIPQLYVDGQFVGGCDIVREMHASGELQKLIGVQVSEPR